MAQVPLHSTALHSAWAALLFVQYGHILTRQSLVAAEVFREMIRDSCKVQMSDWQKRWEIVSHLGEGGQGTVDLVVNAARAGERNKASHAVVAGIEFITPHSRDQADQARLPERAEKLARDIQTITRAPLPSELGALKQLHMPEDAQERSQAQARFAAELQIVSQLKDKPAILKVLDSSPQGIPRQNTPVCALHARFIPSMTFEMSRDF